MRTEFDVPVLVWARIVSYAKTPLMLVSISRVSRNAYAAATSNAVWARFTPFALDDDLYNSFNSRMSHCTWQEVELLRIYYTATLDSGGPVGKTRTIDEPFTSSDVALAAASSETSASEHSQRAYERCLTREFIITALHLNPMFYLCLGSLTNDAEYAQTAMTLCPSLWGDASEELKDQLKQSADFSCAIIRIPHSRLNEFYNANSPCKDPDLVLDKVQYCYTDHQEFWDAIDPALLDREFYERLSERGFPVSFFVSELKSDRAFLLRCLERNTWIGYPDLLQHDREFSLKFIERYPFCVDGVSESLIREESFIKAAASISLKVVLSLSYDIISSAWFQEFFNNYLFEAHNFSKFRRTGGGYYEFPCVLQKLSTVLHAVKANGEWLGCFPKYWSNLRVLKVAIKSYTCARRFFRTKDEDVFCQLCHINPRAIWHTSVAFCNRHPELLYKALEFGISCDTSNCDRRVYWRHINWDKNRELLVHAVRSHPENFKMLAENSPKYYSDKELVLAALEIADGDILWKLGPELQADEDIWKKARATRKAVTV